MVHSLQAVITKKEAVDEIKKRLSNISFVELPQNLVLIPVTDFLHDELDEHYSSKSGAVFMEFDHLSGPIVSFLEEYSKKIPLAYIETDYFGGAGRQSAALWSDSKLNEGPFQSITFKKEELTIASDDKAINRVLKKMGVSNSISKDEFEAVGLERYRTMTVFD